jgi:hypothetical protein
LFFQFIGPMDLEGWPSEDRHGSRGYTAFCCRANPPRLRKRTNQPMKPSARRQVGGIRGVWAEGVNCRAGGSASCTFIKAIRFDLSGGGPREWTWSCRTNSWAINLNPTTERMIYHGMARLQLRTQPSASPHV